MDMVTKWGDHLGSESAQEDGGRAKASCRRRPKVRRDERALLNLTGADRLNAEPPGNVHWLRRTGDGWQPEDAHDRMGYPLWEGLA